MQPTLDTLKQELTRAKKYAMSHVVMMLSLAGVVAIWGRSPSVDMREIGQWLLIIMWLLIVGTGLWERRHCAKLLRSLEAAPLRSPKG